MCSAFFSFRESRNCSRPFWEEVVLGTMGQVLSPTSRRTGRPRALKTMPLNRALWSRVMMESGRYLALRDAGFRCVLLVAPQWLCPLSLTCSSLSWAVPPKSDDRSNLVICQLQSRKHGTFKNDRFELHSDSALKPHLDGYKQHL